MKPILTAAACLAATIAVGGSIAFIKTENKPFHVGLTNTLIARDVIAHELVLGDRNGPATKINSEKQQSIDDAPQRHPACRETDKVCDIISGRDARVETDGAVRAIQAARDATIIAR